MGVTARRLCFGLILVLTLLGSGLMVIRRLQVTGGEALERLKSLERRANPAMLRLAGTPRWSVSRLEHRGRRSGTLYVTPLLAEPVDGGCLIALPYGERTDWAQNLLVAGDGVLQHQGIRYRIGNPRLVPATDALGGLSPLFRITARALGIQRFMRVAVLPALT